MKEQANANSKCEATVTRNGGVIESAHAHGRYEVECIGEDGKVKWKDTIDNVITTVGKNLALDTFLDGSGYTVVGPYLGLISAEVYTTGVVVGDTMASHNGWKEAGSTYSPTYTAPRKTCAWSAASGGSKSLSAALSFAITGTGTVKGLFIVYGTGAVATINSTAGTLWSAGLFTSGDKVVGDTDTLNVTYSAGL